MAHKDPPFVSPGRLNWESCTLPSLKKGLVNEYCFGNSNVTFFGVVNKWPSFGTGQCPPIFQDQKVTLEHRIALRYPTLPFFHGNIFGVSLFRDKIFRTMGTSPFHFSFLRPWWYQAKAWVQGFDVHPKSDAWQQRWKWHRKRPWKFQDFWWTTYRCYIFQGFFTCLYLEPWGNAMGWNMLKPGIGYFLWTTWWNEGRDIWGWGLGMMYLVYL